MKTLEGLIQGSPEWLAARMSYLCASEASAMMGFSPYTSRNALLDQKKTGLTTEVDGFKQKLFDAGHAAEALARPIVEGIIGEDLYPVTGTLEIEGLPLLASFDGITMLEDVVWETKIWNETLAASIRAGDPAPHYWAQMEQQLLVSGAARAYFTTSDGTPEKTLGMWYQSVPERRAALIAGWKQFSDDLAGHQYVASVAKPIGSAIEALPALIVQVEGRVVASNLVAFQQTAVSFIKGINTNLVSDQDFADAERAVKFCKDGEERLELVKSQALAQTASIDELFRAIDLIRDEMRGKRLELDKLVKARKEALRAEILTKSRGAFSDYIDTLNARLGKPYMPFISPDFTGAMKGKKTLATLEGAAADELARAKVEASIIADKIQANMGTLRDLGKDYAFLFSDAGMIVGKASDDLIALIKTRIADHQTAELEKERLRAEAEKDRERIAAEKERLRVEREAAAIQKATLVAATPIYAGQDAAALQGSQELLDKLVPASFGGIDKPTPSAAYMSQSKPEIAIPPFILDLLDEFIDAYKGGSQIQMEKVYKLAVKIRSEQ